MCSAAGREIGETALRTMDENESGTIHLGTPKSCAMSADFRRADLDEDALLTETEFLQGFPIIVAMRAAIRPDL